MQKYYKDFSSKKELMEWLNEHIGEIDFNTEDVKLEFCPNEY